jgi:hypothetical protein
MTASPSTLPSVARLIVAASRSLECYEAGDLAGALVALDGFHARPLPERPEWIAAEFDRLYATAYSGGPVTASALDCIDLARERIRLELGEPVKFAIMPVRMALRSALNCLGAGS